jgi:hypothetical protein
MDWKEIVAWMGTVITAFMCGAIVFRAARDEGRQEGWQRGYDCGAKDAERDCSAFLSRLNNAAPTPGRRDDGSETP